MKSYLKYVPFLIAAILIAALVFHFHNSDVPPAVQPEIVVHQERAAEHEKQALVDDNAAVDDQHRIDSAKTVRRHKIQTHEEIPSLDYLRAVVLHDSLMRADGIR